MAAVNFATVSSGQAVSAPIQLDRGELPLVIVCPSGAATQVGLDFALPLASNAPVNSAGPWFPLMLPGVPPQTVVISGTAGIAELGAPASWVRIRQSAITTDNRSYVLVAARVP